MAIPEPNRIKIFLSYSHADRSLKAEFDAHRSALTRGNLIEVWSDAEIQPGVRWSDEIQAKLDEADIILLLVSPDFLLSEFIWNEELPRAAIRQAAGEVTIIPIIIRECAWQTTLLSGLQVLPRPPRAIHGRRKAQRDAIWTQVIGAIHETAAKIAADGGVRLGADQYLVVRASHLRGYLGDPVVAPDRAIRDEEEVSVLRHKLIEQRVLLPQPRLLTVSGTLFPCALLTSGWWERRKQQGHGEAELYIRDEVQRWLFNGFDLWAPSWDFTWALDAEDGADGPSRFVAQLGTGDEADSLPVIIPPGRARKLREYFLDGRWGGVEAKVTGLLGHRSHFREHFSEIDSFGGLLDYCLWIDGEDDTGHHGIVPLPGKVTSLYSGYLWKCLAPREIVSKRAIRGLEDVYFIWDHTNFASEDAVKYSLDALLHKEAYIRAKVGDLTLIQKSSYLVPGDCKFSMLGAFNLITGKTPDKI